MQDLTIIDCKNLRGRAALIAVIVIALVCGWVTVKWQLGNMLATLTKPVDPNAPPPPLPDDIKLLTEIRDLLKSQQGTVATTPAAGGI